MKFSGLTLLDCYNAKTPKGESLGWLTGVLYLAPAYESSVMNVCPKSTAGCRASCLYTAGLAQVFPKIIQARVRKTQWLARDRAGFLDVLRSDIAKLVRKADKHGLKPAVRLNGTSDLPWLGMEMAREFPDVQMYDYTKIPKPWKRTLPNYHLTFSLSENNLPDAMDAIRHGINVAVVFDTKKGMPLPETWNGIRVVDGDRHDLRFLDGKDKGRRRKPVKPVIVGVRAKGKAKKDKSGFVQITGLFASRGK